MSTPSPVNILKNVPGSITFQGVGIGPVLAAEFRPNIKTGLITAEEFGNQPVNLINVGSAATFSAVLRGYNSAVYASIFPSTQPNVKSGGGRPGLSLSSKGGVLIFTPDASSHPSVTLYNAVPLVDDTAVIRLAGWSDDDYGVQVIWIGLPDSSGRTFDFGA